MDDDCLRLRNGFPRRLSASRDARVPASLCSARAREIAQTAAHKVAPPELDRIHH